HGKQLLMSEIKNSNALRHRPSLMPGGAVRIFRAMFLVIARVLLFILTLFILPLAAHALWWAARDDVAPSWRSADWSSAHLLPEPAAAPQAIVAIYAARVGRWRGIFAHHSWVVIKEAGAA